MVGENKTFPGDQEWRDQVMEGVSDALSLAALRVESRSQSSPPGSPTLGDTYIIGDSPTGNWNQPNKGGVKDNLARWDGQEWEFLGATQTTTDAFLAFVKDEDAVVVWDGTSWNTIGSTGSGGGGSVSSSLDLLIDETDGNVLLEEPRGEVLTVK